MKKVLIINTTLNKGGAARVARDIFENLSSNFDIFFAYGRNSVNDVPKTFYFGNKIEMFIHIFLVRFLGLEGYGSYFSTKKLINFIKRGNFDLINLHNLHGYYVNFFTLLNFLKESNIPIIYSLHDEWPITWMPAHSLGCSHCKTGLGKCNNTYNYPKNFFPFFEKHMLIKKRNIFLNQKHFSITCPSIWLKDNIEQSFLNKYKVETIHNGIDTNLFKPTSNKTELRLKHNLPTDKKIILFSASNLKDKSKGVKYILEAAELLKERDYYFIGIGNGKVSETNNLKIFKYVYDKQKMSELYSLSDAFCFASAAETFLLSAAEALSCGTPVVGFDIPVVRELINNDVGILTKNNSDSLAEAINILMHNEDIQHKMGQYGRILIKEHYSKDIFYKHYLNLYNEILNKNND
jgi:glycosyltransferase involved in cell wall biosynthesis